MTTRSYDLTFVLASDVSEEDQQATVALLSGWITELKGTHAPIDPWGRRRLAYSINEYNEAYYFTLDCELEPLSTVELEATMKLSTKFLRHLLIRKDQ